MYIKFDSGTYIKLLSLGRVLSLVRVQHHFQLGSLCDQHSRVLPTHSIRVHLGHIPLGRRRGKGVADHQVGEVTIGAALLEEEVFEVESNPLSGFSVDLPLALNLLR